MSDKEYGTYGARIHNLVKDELKKMEKLGIKDVAFRRFLSNGKTIGYTTSESWNNFFDVNPDFAVEMANYYKNEIIDVIKNDRKFCLRMGDAHNKSLFLKKMYECGLWNIMAIYKRSNNKIDGFYFVSSIANTEAIANYINNLDYLQNFITLISPKIDQIFSDEKYAQFYIPLFDASFESNFEIKKEKFQLIKTTGLQLKRGGKSYLFSKREIECLALLASGYTVKEMANLLEISAKTIEGYLASVKSKLGNATRQEIIAFAHETYLTTLIEK